MKRPILPMTPAQRAIYEQLLSAARSIGPFREDPKKTSIHLVRKSAFAGVTTRKEALLVTIKAGNDIRSRRIVKHQRVSANQRLVARGRRPGPGARHIGERASGFQARWTQGVHQFSLSV